MISSKAILGLRLVFVPYGLIMTNKRHLEIFTAGCPACNNTVEMVKRITCDSCEVTVLDMNEKAVAERAKELEVSRVPAIAVDGKLAGGCTNVGPDEQVLRDLGIGQAL